MPSMVRPGGLATPIATHVARTASRPRGLGTSIYEASERDFRLVLAEDAISGLYEKGREELENIGVRLMPTARVIESVAHPTPMRSV
jgi:hypothetical protein